LLARGLFANETEIAEVTGFSLANVNKTLRILKLSAAVLEIVKEDPSLFPMSNLYELFLLEDSTGNSERTLEIVKLMKEGEISRKGIQEERAKLERPKGEKQQRNTSRAYKINKEGRNVGSIKEWDTGRVLLDVILPDSSEREAVMLELKTRFGLQGAD
jgi:ParB family chromosome partitioning protein